MIARSLALAVVCCGALVEAQPTLSEDILLMARVKRVMEAHLSGVPNYTCQQSVERYQQKPAAAQPMLVDVLRLEVAFVGGSELFAWPGSERFDEHEVHEVVRNGPFGTGDFTLHARGVFLSSGTKYDYLGLDEIDGRSARKFSYFKPLFHSGYQITNHRLGSRAEVAYKGFFWVDRESLDLIRLTVEAIDIPLDLRVQAVSNVLEYGLLPLGGREALLPRRSELRMTDSDGVTSINKMRLTRCKLFQGESSISFEDLSDAGGAAVKPSERVVLPAGLEVALSLETEVLHGQSAVGDAIEARLKNDIRLGKEILIPKGALARGRIIELSRHEDPTCYTVSFQMDEIEGGGKIAALRLRMLRTEPFSGPGDMRAFRREGSSYYEYPIPARGGFTWFKSTLRLGRGFVTIWETQTIKP
jgi:hypothetical protein